MRIWIILTSCVYSNFRFWAWLRLRMRTRMNLRMSLRMRATFIISSIYRPSLPPSLSHTRRLSEVIALKQNSQIVKETKMKTKKINNKIDHQNQNCVREVQKLWEKRFWVFENETISLSPSKFRIECVQSQVWPKEVSIEIFNIFFHRRPTKKRRWNTWWQRLTFKDVPFPWIEDSICEII